LLAIVSFERLTFRVPVDLVTTVRQGLAATLAPVQGQPFTCTH
jgi:hypothetical protein